MPSDFGIVSKGYIEKPTLDNQVSTAETLCMYILSQNSLGQFSTATNALKTTLRTYLSQFKMIGDSIELKDAYKSLDEALTHGGIANNLKENLVRIESDYLKPKDVRDKLKEVSGILIPGGFGKRGTEGKIAAIKYARLNNIPFFGICFGMQMAVIEAARNLLNIKNASTSEFGNNCTPVVGLLEEWQKGKKKIKGRS